MTQPKIGIIIGSTREGRFGDRPAAWIHAIASQRQDLRVEIVDLRDHSLPFFAEAMSPSWGPPQNKQARAWAARLAGFDGFIVVTPEYNHGPSAVLKNALDYAYTEFVRKPMAFVGYGGVGAARAVEQLRLVAAELQMVSVRNAVHIGMVEFLGLWQQGKSFDEFPHLAQAATQLLDELSWWAATLKTARQAELLTAQ
ncbi:NADPH-dependent FMN reductase [Roseateles sp.]|uniref:NADPH-dependent FMN reductase n=1 Tax=Roseateles sp. TaxID=1971397 RepID=UPI0025CB8BA2|nr:NAD(P)H-dependent oxidoreductase [Roseateles sp.]MBV8036558.1 NAD(P)H-dependent oxidoreductase [Roseateles sp.]